jgi:hypothetical protein
MPEANLVRLQAARNELAANDERQVALRTELSVAEDELTALRSSGATAARARTAERRVKKLREEQTRLAALGRRIAATIERLRDRVRLTTPELSLEQLDGRIPVTMLPVRLETRYGAANTSLRIRVYPEQVHVDSHEPELTAEELGLAKVYWQQRWAAGTDETAKRAAWNNLARAARPPRARHVVLTTIPTNLERLGQGEPVLPEVPKRPGPWTRAAVARLLPEQWVAIGYVGGAEVFRRWSRPIVQGLAVGLAPDLDDPGDLSEPPDEQEALAVDEGMRWMLDYEAALEAGMAITVTDADLTGRTLAAGLDELIVLGVDWSLKPDAAAVALSEQFARHAVSEGLALLAAGTPTNNTAEERAAAGTDPRLDIKALDPTESEPAVDAGAARIGRALGLGDLSAFAGIPGRGGLDDTAAADMHNALWAPTAGYFLDQLMRPLVPTATSDDVADHFRRHVRGRGPFATLRVGRQPYGVLPVIAGTFRSNDTFEQGLANQLAALRPFWASAQNAVPQLGTSDRPDADLVDLLRRTPRSGKFRFREAVGVTTSSSLLGFDLAAIFQEQFAHMLLALAGTSGNPELARITVSPAQRAVPVPLVTRGELSETATLDPNYIRDIRGETTRSGGLRRLLTKPQAAGSLLEALLRQAASLEYAIGTTGLVVAHELDTGVLISVPEIATVPDREVFEIAEPEASGNDVTSMLGRVRGPVELAEARVTPISGTRNLADFIATRPDAELFSRIATARFAAFRQSLARLAEVPTAELGRLAADTLDCVSHRLDAWFTSLATRRLDAIRSETEQGCHIGMWGYVEQLAPRTAPASLGYLQAPSIAHATTAALLRSAHLARREDDEGVLALDLTSTRVSLALELIEGSRRDQPIGALLGYRFERGLRDRRITLAQYILPFRQAAPLATAEAGLDDSQPLETIAARDVVDGIELLQRWKTDRDGLFASLSVPVAAADAADVDTELRRLDDALDAVSDLLLAEGVHQTVLGNSERAAAALDALDRQTAIPEVGVVRTPRTGRGVNHRLLILMQAATAAPGWAAHKDSRCRAEPRVDAWAGRMLGRPTRYRFAAEVHNEAGAVVQPLTARLSDLDISALSTICACAASGAESATEIEERLALTLSRRITAPDAARLVLLDDPPPGSALGLRDLLELGAQLLDLLASARHADQRALSPDAPLAGAPPDTRRPGPGVDSAELRARADGAVSRLRTVVDALDAAARSAATTDLFITRLLAVASAGIRSAVPLATDVAALAAQADTVLETARRRFASLAAMEAAFDRATADPAGEVAHDLARLREVFGAGFPVVALFTVADSAQLTQSAADPALLGDDGLAAAAWLTQHALVRPAASRLVGALTAVEMLGGGSGGLEALTVAQLPHMPGDRWLGLPQVAGIRPAATVSVVAHRATPIDFGRPLAAFILDQWSDVIPNAQETTGVSFHYDAPGARAPQTLLVAVPGDRNAPSWTVEALAGSIREAIALARIRPLDGDDIEGVGRFLPAIYLPFNIKSKTPSVNLAEIISTAILADNLAFLEQE